MNNKFKMYIDSVQFGKISEIKAKIINECVITNEIYKNWYAGRSNIPERHQRVIEKLAGKKIFSQTNKPIS